VFYVHWDVVFVWAHFSALNVFQDTHYRKVNKLVNAFNVNLHANNAQ